MYLAEVYRSNYYKMLDKDFKNFENYEKFTSFLDKITDPLKFYEIISQNDKLSDITFMYDLGDAQEAFNILIESVGVEL